MKRKSLPTGRDFLFVEGYGNENPGAFQSPRPLRGATELCFSGGNFNPRAPCGARLGDVLALTPAQIFQPTRPLRGATPRWSYSLPRAYFNPRAPCGARPGSRLLCGCHSDFNPRVPCGARQQECTNHYAHFCDNRQISDVFAQNADCQGILFLFCARKTCKF